MDEDVGSGTVGNRLRDAIHYLDYTPYHRVEGDYTLSTVGEFMVQEYSGDIPEEDIDGAIEVEEGVDSEQQVTLQATTEEE
jgi:hypothetical protein